MDQRLVDEPRQPIEEVRVENVIIGADGLDRFQRASAGKDREPLKQSALAVYQQIVAPIDRGAEGLLAG
jgi:hypothetical protein